MEVGVDDAVGDVAAGGGCRCPRPPSVTWYNTEHRHSGIRFVTPQQRHQGTDTTILAARTHLYEEAKAKHPDRWRGRAVRNWTPIGTVLLNPDRESPNADAETKSLSVNSKLPPWAAFQAALERMHGHTQAGRIVGGE